ncbi:MULTISPECIES: hypothetical protein [Marinobacter]|uniref:Uncharacterized protein n=1 Tax=Marinobacter metalliresistant TaxID=2961995 RepID=A0ABZ2W3R8_9GAMM|nr:hypothetical protein [Marinobacter sp. Arc7-DN-1]AXS82105.1 hypothetical protein D0851_03055 [Marinobacter sp. Arc7-DN-1]|tara:strand:- start:258 stop:587 length:330 start_codon:yes stop_codon:yes gene_type:complete
MNKEHFSEDEWKVIGQAVARLRASVMAVTFGIVGGLMLFVATVWLIILGPTGGSEHVGPTLGLLANFFPGYSVTWSGAVVGAFYGALSGAIAGFVLAVIYNRIVIYRRR